MWESNPHKSGLQADALTILPITHYLVGVEGIEPTSEG